MRILVAGPVPETSDYGNGVTARRWARLLRNLGHEVRVAQDYDGERYDLLIALHARKSEAAIRAFSAACPDTPVVIALTGTDLYPDLVTGGVDLGLLGRAARIVVLQPRGLLQVPLGLRGRTRVIIQSMPPIPGEAPAEDRFEVAFLAHARPVKDPLRLSEAVRLLPSSSRITVTHVGGVREDDVGERLRAESAENPRYTWLGPLPRPEALAVLARSRLLVLTSLHEGGANVVTEALAAGVPIVSTRVPGSVGLLGEDYAGYFPVGDTAALATVLDDAEHDRDGLYTRIRRQCAARRASADPERETQAWRRLLAEAVPANSGYEGVR
ncbi:selenoneine biosynthesis selenosugar synthase SenB [Amycolatopsis roodepoortensis]|uniref:Glycosyltransferase (TIGR04348 family) n=1 Tax=Amycolatopsis roodepoortensis TaxID=700274 RepID=A0ABR9L7G9_9PSEU|nr:selenoneine biosynthesis selenosugar synthase SenB [Amycolatopsis roodepoortensis]MBE1576332.1 putative glycosyltransferase (TIGR04348 family) [Amycolatopsis roodepoortensis]